MQKEWNIVDADVGAVEILAEELKINKILCQILANRGIISPKEAKRFIGATIEDLEDPLLMKDMERAVGRMRKAITKKEKILIFSDYDVDGITSCAILESQLQSLGANVSHYIPHRIKEGYGLSMSVVNLAIKKGIKLLICLDCGITGFDEVEKLNSKKIETVIVDHHNPKADRLPKAFAIVNPKQQGCLYPFKDFAAVGLVYKLAYALSGKHKQKYLEFVTLGTIADVVPLLGENRIIVRQGLDYLNKSSCLGIKALIKESGLKDKEINPGRVSFILAPRINASGRVDSAETSLDLLLAQSEEEAAQIARNLNEHNRNRQKIGNGVMKEAIDLVERTINFKEHHVIVLSKDDWHLGVLGIVASRIAERYFRPTIIISSKNGRGKGSGRSIQGFHLYNALTECSAHLLEFGGHSHAVGLNIETKNLKEFRDSLNNIAKERIVLDELRPSIDIDAQLPLGLIKEKLIEECNLLGPFGAGNPRPVFCTHNLTVKSNAILLGRETIKFWVTDGEFTFQAIGFGFKDVASYIVPKTKIDLAYTLSLDNWRDINSILLEVKDIRFY